MSKLINFFTKAFYVHDAVDRVFDKETKYPININPNNNSLVKAIEDKVSELSNKYDNIYLMWSGGIDSTTALFGFIKYNKPITVLITKNSKIEYPECYRDLISNKYNNVTPMEISSLDEVELSGNYCVLTGELGDQMCGSAIAMYYATKYRMLPYRNVLSQDLISITEESVIAMLKTRDINVGEYLWALNFIYKYENVINRLATSVKKEFGKEINLEHFFNSDMFQDWSILTFRQHANFPNKYKYKQDYKDFIYSVNNDKLYWKYKRKLGSLINSGLFKSALDPEDFTGNCLVFINKPEYENVII